MLPLHETGMVSGLLCGVLFGYVLENAGFGSPLKLTSQFRLTDWSVFKVMFTAIVVAAFGWYLGGGLVVRAAGCHRVFCGSVWWHLWVCGGVWSGHAQHDGHGQHC